MSQTATPTAPNPLQDAGEYLASLLKQQTIHDTVSGNTIAEPIEKAEFETALSRSAAGVTQESLKLALTVSNAADLNQAQVLDRAETVLRTIPKLAEHFSFGADPATPEKPHPVAHVWHRDTEKLVITFDLPPGVDSAKVVESIEEWKKHGQAAAAPATIDSAAASHAAPETAAAPAQDAQAPAPSAPVRHVQPDAGPAPAHSNETVPNEAAPLLTPERPVVGSGSYTSGFSKPLGPPGKFR